MSLTEASVASVLWFSFSVYLTLLLSLILIDIVPKNIPNKYTVQKSLPQRLFPNPLTRASS